MQTSQTVKEECEALLVRILKEKYSIVDVNPKVEVHFEQSRKADASCSIAFQLAGKLKKKPAEIAEEIVESCNTTNIQASKQAKQAKQQSKFVEKISSVNGFVNFTFSNEYYEQALSNSLEKNYGDATLNGKTAMVEYSSPNVGKPLHIGHVRSTIYGDVLKKLLKSQGWKTIGSNYLCEAGTQVSKLIVGLRHYGALKVKDEKELLEYYVKINAEIEKNPALAEETRNTLEKMEAGEKEIAAELKKVRDLSVPPIHRIYKQLEVEFDEEIFDSDFIESGKKVVERAIQNKIAFKDKNNEVVANLEEYKIPNLIILRSNGTTLYSTRDLGLAESRWKKYKPDFSIIVTGSDQILHFKQFIKILELLKMPIAEKMKHIGYGLVMLPEGKISSRLGRVVLLQDIIDEAAKAAEKEILSRQSDVEQKELKQRALAIGVSALKFAILKVSAEKNITFDFEKMASFEGDTGPYLQYSLVRCKSILEKAENKNKQTETQKIQKTAKKITKTREKYELNNEEKELLLQISGFPTILANSANSLSPHVLCDYLLKTAAAFSKFYSMHSVLEAENQAAKEKRIQIVKATTNVMQSGLNLLGITPLEKM
ncbi:MAG: arginine--tRNA ligase [Candidatus Micrarchaeota archaeon]